MSCRRDLGVINTHNRHPPRKRGIQYAAASRFGHERLWNTGSPAFAGDDNWFPFQTPPKIPFKTFYAVNPSGKSRSRAHVSPTREPLMTTDTPVIADVPSGFEPRLRKSPLTDPWEPLYSTRTDRAVIIGLRLAKPHTNGRGLIHGGLIAALADAAMGHSCAHCMGGASSLVTLGLAGDFVGTAEVGQWLAGERRGVK